MWIVSIGDWEWQLDEKTAEISALNDKATKLLEKITLRTYHNTKYGYSLKYPPEWDVLDVLKEGVSISSVATDGTIVYGIFIWCLPNPA